MLYYRIRMTFDRPADFSQRGWKEVQRGAMRAAAEHWHANMLPRHFERSARERYGYQPRSDAYQYYKVRAVMNGKAVSAVDLIYSGTTRDAAAKQPLIKAFPTRARLDLLVPPYISMTPDRRGKRKDAPAMGDELTRVTWEEAEELAQVACDFCARAIAPRSVTHDTAVRFGKRVTVTTSTASRPNGSEFLQSYTVICE
jgi:hypothetical protein